MKKLKPYIISVFIAILTGGISALLTKGNMDIYETINTPTLSPPSLLFAIVWTLLYALMGVSAAMVYLEPTATDRKKQNALFTYAVSLFVNFLWSIIFFNMRAYLFAFLWLVLLEFLIIKTILEYNDINKIAAYLQIPYAVWVAFAGYLNLGILILNK